MPPTVWTLDKVNLSEIENSLTNRAGRKGEPKNPPPGSAKVLVVMLRSFVVLDTGPFSRSTDVRIDTLVSTLRPDGRPHTVPGTFRFPGAAANSKLPIENGLLLSHGEASKYLSVFITASKDGSEQPTLDELLSKKTAAEAASAANLVASATGTPGAVVAGVAAAARLADLAVSLIRAVSTDSTLALYRACWLQADELGIGKHPEFKSPYRTKEASFRYEIMTE